MNNKYYVYALLDTRKPGTYTYGKYTFNYEPFYIGKGCRGRAKVHIHQALAHEEKYYHNKWRSRLIRKICDTTGNPPKIVAIKNLTESSAYEKEKILIDLVGRRDLGNGPLLNFSDGGKGGTGVVRSTPNKISKLRNSLSNKKAFLRKTKKELSKTIAKRNATRARNKQANSLSARKSAQSFWNGDEKAIAERNRKLAESKRKAYEDMSESQRRCITAKRALGRLLNRYTFASEEIKEKVREKLSEKIERFYAKASNNHVKWCELKLKIQALLEARFPVAV